MPVSLAVLAAGHLLAVPFTLYVPGFLRLWRRREPKLYGAAQLGGVLIAAGWAARGNALAATFNALWVGGFAVAYAAEGRKRGALPERPTG